MVGLASGSIMAPVSRQSVMDSIAPARTGCPYRPFLRGSLNRRSLHDPPSHPATTRHECRTHGSAAKVCAQCQARSSQGRPTRLCPASAATSPDGDLQAGHSVPTRLGWDQVTSTDGITLSDGDGRKGFAAVVFDYRRWGGSAGSPRGALVPAPARELRLR